MAEVHGVAGEWARVRGTVLGLWPLFLGVFAAGFALALLIFGSLPWGALLLALAACGTFWSARRGMRHVERFFKGARGEERVSRILRDLPAGYHVFNDFVAGGHHVDHVVAGPAGVFAIETKFWSGRVTVEEGHILVDGRLPSRSPLAQALGEAKLVKGALAAAGWKGEVTPIVAFASDTFAEHIAEVGGAVVINSCDLRKSFATERVVLPPDELERLVGLMGVGR